VETGGAQVPQHRRVECGVVVGVHGVERDAHQRRLDDLTSGERLVELRGAEAVDSVPHGDVRRHRFLRLEGDDATDRLNDGQPRPPEQQLPLQRGAVQLPHGQRHGRAYCPVAAVIKRRQSELS
jgi:hypothetical protein